MCIIRLCNGLDVLCVLCKLQALLYVNRVKVADISNKPTLVGEYAFSLMEFVGSMTHVIFGGSVGIMSP